jgi:cellulose 1,4-beta-cellobiosidase
MATAYTPHACDDPGQVMCTDTGCGGTYSDDRYAGTCDADGCDFNSWRMGDQTFYGPGLTVDTDSVFTVVTQFIGGGDGLSEIKRFYVQDGTVIPNSESKIEGVTGNSVNQEFCAAQKEAFGDENVFEQHGGFGAMAAGMEQGMVLVMSVWDDHYANMLWLDSTYPTDGSGPGYDRGPCATDSGVPADVESESPDASVTFSNLKWGPINSTFSAGA